LAEVWWPGRLDTVSRRPLVILDGAHNPAAAQELASELRHITSGRRLRLVFGAMRDKNWIDMWAALRPLVHEAIVTEPTPPRRADAQSIARAIGRDVPVRVVLCPEEAAREALAASAHDDVVAVTGSLFLVGDVYRFFLRQQGRHHLFDPWHPGAGDATEAPA
jgi:dihydrofolate synthase/folylpolyglutamate synthase